MSKKLFSDDPSKAPGEDNFTALFYQKYWEVVGSEMYRTVLEFLNNGGELSDINHTRIVMILKVAATKVCE